VKNANGLQPADWRSSFANREPETRTGHANAKEWVFELDGLDIAIGWAGAESLTGGPNSDFWASRGLRTPRLHASWEPKQNKPTTFPFLFLYFFIETEFLFL